MANDHVAQPFRDILENLLKPKSFPLPVEISAREQPKTRFHPDDIQTALSVLLWYWPAQQDASNADERMREAFSRCMVTLDAAMRRREEDDLDDDLESQYRYERTRGGAR